MKKKIFVDVGMYKFGRVRKCKYIYIYVYIQIKYFEHPVYVHIYVNILDVQNIL